MDVTIRRYRPADRETVLALHYAGVEQIDADFFAATGLPDDGNADTDFDDTDMDDIPGRYLDDGGEFLVGEIDGRVVTMGGLMKETPASALVKRMRTLPGLQGHGYGRRLLDHLEQRARELGYAELLADPLTTNTGARRFYERAGYQEIHQKQVGIFTVAMYRKLL